MPQTGGVLTQQYNYSMVCILLNALRERGSLHRLEQKRDVLRCAVFTLSLFYLECYE